MGDYAIYDGVLYKCTTAITVAEAWDSTHWTAVKLANETPTFTGGTGIEVSGSTIKATGVEYKNNSTVQPNALKFVRMTQAQYDALAGNTDADTMYIII